MGINIRANRQSLHCSLQALFVVSEQVDSSTLTRTEQALSISISPHKPVLQFVSLLDPQLQLAPP